jgi:hypothetical protein
MHRKPKDRDSLDHLQANLLKGVEENYAWLGQHWPDSRCCVYDMKTGTFSVPAEFAENNAEAFQVPGAK